MAVDPEFAQIVADSADAALFAAAMAADDTWEWQRILDEVTDVTHAKRLLAALSGLFINYVTAACQRVDEDPAAWLHGLALAQLAEAKAMRDET